MPRKKALRTKPQDEYAFLAVRINQFDAQAGAWLHSHIHCPETSLDDHDRDPLYPGHTQINLSGAITYPDDRAGHGFSMSISAAESPTAVANLTVKDMQTRDEYGSPTYRTYRGRSVPVYDKPPGLGLIDKVRAETAWRAWAFLPPRAVTNMLALLSYQRPLFLSIQERKTHRARWITSIILQTTDPAQE